MRALIDKDNVVVNVIEITDGANYTPPAGTTLLDAKQSARAQIGARWDGTKFILPTPPPETKDFKNEYARAASANERIALIAEKLGLL